MTAAEKKRRKAIVDKILAFDKFILGTSLEPSDVAIVAKFVESWRLELERLRIVKNLVNELRKGQK